MASSKYEPRNGENWREIQDPIHSHSLKFPEGNRAQAGGSKFHDPARDPSAYRKQAQQLGACNNRKSIFFLEVHWQCFASVIPPRNMCRLAYAGWWCGEN